MKTEYFDVKAIIGALLIPVIPMLYLFNQNAQYLVFSQFILCVIVFTAFFLALYIGFLFLFKSNFAALLAELVFCVIWFAIKPSYTHFSAWMAIPPRLVVFFYLLIFAIFLCLLKKRKKTDNDSLWVKGICLITAINVLLSGGTAILRNSPKKTEKDEVGEKTFFIQAQGNIRIPNVYWIHTDGMLGFDAVEKYYGDDQHIFKKELEQRGFSLNPSAKMEAAHSTAVAIPTLMCPDYYDDNLVSRLQTQEQVMQLRNDIPYLKLLDEVRLNNEMIDAFRQKSYQVQVMDDSMTRYFFPVGDINYKVLDNKTPVMISKETISKQNLYQRLVDQTNLESLVDLINKTMPLDCFGVDVERLVKNICKTSCEEFFDYHALQNSTYEKNTLDLILVENTRGKYRSDFARCFYELVEQSVSPSLSVIFYSFAHRPFIYDENGEKKKGEWESAGSYYSTHQYATKVLVNIIDEILCKDPDAIIVLQADHGLHGLTADQIKEQLGCDEEGVLDMWNSVMSAIRLPEQYKTDDVKYALQDPRNMSRYLVNTFIGDNYTYIDNGH